MPILGNARHEIFAQAMASGTTADEAYAQAGFKADRGNASRLTAKDSIRARIEEIRTLAAEKLEIDLRWLIERAEEARAAAMSAGQYAGAISAIKEIGILTGHRVEKRQQLSRSVEQMSDAELLEIARGKSQTQH